MRGKIDTQTRMDPGASIMLDGGEPVSSKWVAVGRNRSLGQEFMGGEERTFAYLAHRAKVRELDARGALPGFFAREFGRPV